MRGITDKRGDKIKGAERVINERKRGRGGKDGEEMNETRDVIGIGRR